MNVAGMNKEIQALFLIWQNKTTGSFPFLSECNHVVNGSDHIVDDFEDRSAEKEELLRHR